MIKLIIEKIKRKYEDKTQGIIDLMLEDEQNSDDGAEPQIEFPQD